MQLGQLQKNIEQVRSLGLKVVALSVDPVDTTQKLSQRLGLTDVTLYSDKGGAASKAFGIYDANTELSLAATYIVRKGGQISYRFIGKDKAERPSLEMIVAAAKAGK